MVSFFIRVYNSVRYCAYIFAIHKDSQLWKFHKVIVVFSVCLDRYLANALTFTKFQLSKSDSCPRTRNTIITNSASKSRSGVDRNRQIAALKILNLKKQQESFELVNYFYVDDIALILLKICLLSNEIQLYQNFIWT